MREAMGEILKPAFPLAKAHWQMHQAIQTQGFFRFLAQNDAWVAPRFQGDAAGTAALTDRPWVKMDDDAAFGARHTPWGSPGRPSWPSYGFRNAMAQEPTQGSTPSAAQKR
ncbi:MAG: hypothetical protein K8I02_05790 [Candidatus Methylomirabilis sp.]|nr:hypothetical protein [Deltaproteobacteria bacterium]